MSSIPESTSLAPTVSLASGYSLDTIAYFDSAMHNDVFMIIPVSSHTAADAFVIEKIRSRLADFETDIDTTDAAFGANSNSFMAFIHSIDVHGTLISYGYGISVYYSGGAHGLCVNESFNYDTAAGKLLTFNDYFDVQSAEDTALLMNEIKEHLWSTGIYFNTLYSLDFCLAGDSISFNFDDYEIASYAEGAMRSVVARDKISKLIRSKYQ